MIKPANNYLFPLFFNLEADVACAIPRNPRTNTLDEINCSGGVA